MVVECNRGYESIQESLQATKDIVTTLLQATVELIRLLQCKNIVPIYQEAFYTASCDYSVHALYWIYSASFIMSFFGWLMILFRASTMPTVYTDIVVTSSTMFIHDGDNNNEQFVEEDDENNDMNKNEDHDHDQDEIDTNYTEKQQQQRQGGEDSMATGEKFDQRQKVSERLDTILDNVY